MAANINFGHYFEFYWSDMQNYSKNGFFDQNNAYIDGLHLYIAIIL